MSKLRYLFYFVVVLHILRFHFYIESWCVCAWVRRFCWFRKIRMSSRDPNGKMWALMYPLSTTVVHFSFHSFILPNIDILCTKNEQIMRYVLLFQRALGRRHSIDFKIWVRDTFSEWIFNFRCWGKGCWTQSSTLYTSIPTKSEKILSIKSGTRIPRGQAESFLWNRSVGIYIVDLFECVHNMHYNYCRVYNLHHHHHRTLFPSVFFFEVLIRVRRRRRSLAVGKFSLQSPVLCGKRS